jgi:hypothetical protein
LTSRIERKFLTLLFLKNQIMKLKHYLNLFLLCAITPAFAQETGAQINFETTTIDYGTIANGSNGERVFSFTNSGSEALIIKNVQSSCGCTIPKKPEGPIAPGETSEIIVRYDTKRTGPFRKTITVTTNVEQNTIVALKIKGTVLPK